MIGTIIQSRVGIIILYALPLHNRSASSGQPSPRGQTPRPHDAGNPLKHCGITYRICSSIASCFRFKDKQITLFIIIQYCTVLFSILHPSSPSDIGCRRIRGNLSVVLSAIYCIFLYDNRTNTSYLFIYFFFVVLLSYFTCLF